MNPEELASHNESPSDRHAFGKYTNDVERGKSLIQLIYTQKAITPWVRSQWSGRSFTAVKTPVGDFDAVTCTISYHFNKHGTRFRSVHEMTIAAVEYLRTHRKSARVTAEGDLKLPRGRFNREGRIVWFE